MAAAVRSSRSSRFVGLCRFLPWATLASRIRFFAISGISVVGELRFEWDETKNVENARKRSLVRGGEEHFSR
jgi:hypothetical protein